MRYLSATADSQLFQPIFVRVREDKKEQDCLRAQLKSTNRQVVDGEQGVAAPEWFHYGSIQS